LGAVVVTGTVVFTGFGVGVTTGAEDPLGVCPTLTFWAPA